MVFLKRLNPVTTPEQEPSICLNSSSVCWEADRFNSVAADLYKSDKSASFEYEILRSSRICFKTLSTSDFAIVMAPSGSVSFRSSAFVQARAISSELRTFNPSSTKSKWGLTCPLSK